MLKSCAQCYKQTSGMAPYRVVHRGNPYMRGSGVGSIFKSLYSWLIPLFKAGATTAVKTGTKAVKSKVGRSIIKEAKKELKKGGITALSDVIAGKDPMPQMQKNVKDAQTKIAKAVKRQATPVVKKKKRGPAVKTKRRRLTDRAKDIW